MTTPKDSRPQNEETTRNKLPPSLLARHEEALSYAREYREKYGDPVDNLAELLERIVGDDIDLWESILDQPDE